MEALQDIWLRLAIAGFETDKGSIHSYISIYDQVFKPFRDREINVLEIGLFNGYSMKMWEQYFKNAKVYGIDCSDQPHGGMADLRPMIAEGTHNIIIGDATSKEDIEKHFGQIKFSLIIDDGNHNIGSQLETFNLLKDKLEPDGLYVIEDLENLERDQDLFWKMGDGLSIEIVDLRPQKNRFDDVLVLIRKTK